MEGGFDERCVFAYKEEGGACQYVSTLYDRSYTSNHIKSSIDFLYTVLNVQHADTVNASEFENLEHRVLTHRSQ